MKNKMQILRDLDLGNMIAELDDILTSSFVTSTTYNDFIDDRYDIIRGAKGTGKTALLLYVFTNKNNIKELEDAILIKANEHRGDPHFKKAFENIDTSCRIEIYADAWKVYFINLLWPKIESLGINKEKINKLKNYLKKAKIITTEEGFLRQLLHSVLRARYTIKHEKTEFGIKLDNIEKQNIIMDFNYIFTTMSDLFIESEQAAWILLDRLDDAFPDWSDSSQNALRSLFYVYKDLLGLDGIKLKTFIRSDIFDRITNRDGFTSLSHIHARTSPSISWDELRIEEFVYNRFRSSFPRKRNSEIIESVLGKQIDIGKNKPSSIRWLINHLKDGLGICTPRDILSLLNNARQNTLAELETNSMKSSQSTLFSKTSIKLAWEETSKDKLHTQIYAENPKSKNLVELFRDGKSEYSNEKLAKLLGKGHKDSCAQLQYIGILSKYGNNMKIPFLFRPCLNIRQGKA